MATNPASASSVNSPAQPLWHAPLFVLGVMALAAVWFGRSYCPHHGACRQQRDLAEARQLLAKADGDPDAALQLAEGVLELKDSSLDHAAEAAFLAGCACVRIAEKADPVRARETWPRAKRFLEEAEQKGIAEEDKPALAYRLAKIEYHTSSNVSAVIARLEETVPNCDRRAEGYALLSQAYLKLPKPDLGKALEANAKLRDVAEATEAELAAAKLLGGELLLKQNKPEEARKSLEMIGSQSPPAILVKARLLQARSYQEEKAYSQAIALYIDLLAKHKAAVGDPAVIHYNLGLCYRQLDQPREAAKELQECVTVSRGPEGQAAALLLAETRLAEPALEQAIEPLTMAVARVGAPAEWANTLAPLSRAREVFEKALAAYRQASRHELAMKLLDAYARVAAPPRLLRLRAEVAGEWARLKGEAVSSPESQQLAKQMYKVAAEACDKLAELRGQSLTEQGEHLWASAQHYLACGEKALALARLEQVVTLNLDQARLGEAWYRLAESYRAADKGDSALAAYKKCLDYDSRYRCRARYQLAMAALGANPPDIDEAQATLVFNVKMLRWESDDEALAQSLFALGDLLYQRRDYRGVVRYLEDALERFKDNPEVTKARFQLANSYRQISNQEEFNKAATVSMSAEAKAHFDKEHRRWLQKAADEFAVLEQLLETPEGKDRLTAEQRAQVPDLTAKCWLRLNEWEKALVIYEKMIERNPGKVEELVGLGGAVACHGELKQIERVKQRLLQMKQLLPQMPEEVRKPWEEWHDKAVKILNETLNASAAGARREGE